MVDSKSMKEVIYKFPNPKILKLIICKREQKHELKNEREFLKIKSLNNGKRLFRLKQRSFQGRFVLVCKLQVLQLLWWRGKCLDELWAKKQNENARKARATLRGWWISFQMEVDKTRDFTPSAAAAFLRHKIKKLFREAMHLMLMTSSYKSWFFQCNY